MRKGQTLDSRADITQPIQFMDSRTQESEFAHESSDAFNTYILHERESHAKRTQIRMPIEVWARARGERLGYTRLRGRNVVLSLPSAEQAEIAIEIIRQVCASMHGKHLTKK
jgi:hypothetical protein